MMSMFDGIGMPVTGNLRPIMGFRKLPKEKKTPIGKMFRTSSAG
jgi:hypothetical protein